MSRTVIITGASDGIGLAAARALASTGARLVLIGRDPEKTKAAANELQSESHTCDFGDLAAVQELAAILLHEPGEIAALLNNAGGMMGAARETTVDGYEATWQVNHLAPFVLTRALLPRLTASKAAVIATSSSVSRMAKLDFANLNSECRYAPTGAYAVAKLANIMFTRELLRRCGSDGLHPVSFQPGPVATNFGAHSKGSTRVLYHSPLKRLLPTPEQGAATLVWLASTKPGREWTVGAHYGKRRVVRTHRAAADAELCAELWERSAEQVDRVLR